MHDCYINLLFDYNEYETKCRNDNEDTGSYKKRFFFLDIISTYTRKNNVQFLK